MRPCVALFDLDGVLSGFVQGALAAHGKTLPPAEVEWDFCTQIGFNGPGDPAFWKPLQDHDFWFGLPVLDDGMAVFERVAAAIPKDRIGFLSSGLCPGSADGKRAWIKKHLPDWEKHLLLGTHKSLLAAPCKLLFDDYVPNVTGFRAAGGRAVTCPRPWNVRRGETCGLGRFDPAKLAAEILTAAA